jgi:hypothetical protein
VTTMIRWVPLQRLPHSLRFPSELQHRIKYDADKKQLQFDGYMSKTEFDVLIRLHNDIEYQRAMEHLFQICIFETEDETSRNRHKVVCMGVAAVAAIVVAGACSLWLFGR